MSTIFFHDVLGDYFFIPMLMMQLYVFMIHIFVSTKNHYRENPYKESFVRVTLAFETYCLHTGFWLLNYTYLPLIMKLHYIFHVSNNPWLAFVDLPDFSKPEKNRVLWWFEITFLWLFDVPCHTYLIYHLCTSVMPFNHVMIAFSLFSVIVYLYPWSTVVQGTRTPLGYIISKFKSD